MSKDRSPKSLLGKPVGFRALFIYPALVWLIFVLGPWTEDLIFMAMSGCLLVQTINTCNC